MDASTEPAQQHTSSSVKELLPSSLWGGRVYSSSWQQTGTEAKVVNPSSGASLGTIGIAHANDMEAAAVAASRAQKTWLSLPYEQRAAVFRRAAQIAEEYRSELVDWLVLESGSVRTKAQFEVAVTIKCLWESSAMPSQAAGHVLPSEPGRLNVARRRAIGVVGVISPFNFPLYLAMRAVAPALAVGNAVILKPDPRTAVSGGVVIARLFEAAGLPSDVLHMLPGGRDAGEALCSDSRIGMIQFTGSTAAGRAVGELAGRNLKKVSLELGGKNSLIVLDDADIDLAVANAAWSVFLHQGQICMSAGRILVQKGIAEEFTKRLAAKARSLTTGDASSANVALGPLINQHQVDNVVRIIRNSLEEGARLEIGGSAEGLFFDATVLSGVQPGMTVYREETFGPVATVCVFDRDDDAVAMANDTEFGLSAGIISSSVSRALRIGEKLQVGLMHINDQTVNDEVVNPFGGVGASGNGASIGGPANWEEFTHWQWMTIKSEAPAYPI